MDKNEQLASAISGCEDGGAAMQQRQHIPFLPQSCSSSYHYPSPITPVSTPSWQPHSPHQAFYNPSLDFPSSGLTQTLQTSVASIVPSSEIIPPSTPTSEQLLELASAPSPESPVIPPRSYTSTYSQMGTISTSATALVSPLSSSSS